MLNRNENLQEKERERECPIITNREHIGSHVSRYESLLKSEKEVSKDKKQAAFKGGRSLKEAFIASLATLRKFLKS